MVVAGVFIGFGSAHQEAVDLTGRGGAPFAALAALSLQLGMAAQAPPVEVVQLGGVQHVDHVVHL